MDNDGGGELNVTEKELCLVQAKGKLNRYEALNPDIISSLAFNSDGSMLAVGDRGGRVVILSHTNNTITDQYNVYTTYTSHYPDFDYLKSVDIEEKINSISWLNRSYNFHALFTTNGNPCLKDKTIKLFKIPDKLGDFDKSLKTCKNGVKDSSKQNSFDEASLNGSNIQNQLSWSGGIIKIPTTSRFYDNAHHYNIHTVAVCPNQEYFISADELRINLWSINRNDLCFCIVDCKPEDLEQLNEIITCVVYHPIDPDVFMYSTNLARTNLCDKRVKAICDIPTLTFFDVLDERMNLMSPEAAATASISCINYASDSRQFLTRNFYQVKIWDSRMPQQPLERIDIHEFLCSDSKLTYLCDNDFIFDRFTACFADNDKSVITGSYDDLLCLINRSENHYKPHTRTFYSTSIDGLRNSHNHFIQPLSINKVIKSHKNFEYRVSLVERHPFKNVVAVASHQNLLIYNTSRLICNR